MDENVYKTPESELTIDSPGELVLASRWARLLAALIDGFIMVAVTLPIMFLTGGFDGIAEGREPSFLYTLVIAAIGIIAFVLINGKILVAYGQTWGKRVAGIRITTLEGAVPSAGDHLLKRYAVYFLPGQVPMIGQVFSLVNILFIFGKEKRCLHDYVGRTKVVKV